MTEELQLLSPEALAVATPAELAAYERALTRELALLSPLDYARYTTDDRIKPYRHTELLSRYAKALCEHALYDSGPGPAAVFREDRWEHPDTGEEAHNILVISCPPQHGKSSIITETVPAWYLTLHPDAQVIVTGYETEFAKDFGRANRNKIESAPELGATVDKTSRAANNWRIDGHDGGLITAGAGGAITGRRADLICIDDPVKNSEDALSEAKRRNNVNWWETTIKSRIRTDTVVLIIQTRWHEGDLAGHVAAKERCYTLNLPALAFDEADPDTGISLDPDTLLPDPLGRRPGEALCPELQTRKMLLAKQEGGDGGDEPGGMLWFSALYQGKPNIEGGGYLSKPYRYYRIRENHSGRRFFRTKDSTGQRRDSYLSECVWFITSDLAVSTKSYADYTVFALFAWTPYGELLLVDMERERIAGTDHMRRAEAFWAKARSYSDGAGVRFFGIEQQTVGLSLISRLRAEARIPVKELKADRDKIARAMPVGVMIRQDEFFLPEGHDILPELEKEMSIFPNGTHDDMVDTLGYAAEEARYLPRKRRRTEDSEAAGGAVTLASQVEAHVRRKHRTKRKHPVFGRF